MAAIYPVWDFAVVHLVGVVCTRTVSTFGAQLRSKSTDWLFADVASVMASTALLAVAS